MAKKPHVRTENRPERLLSEGSLVMSVSPKSVAHLVLGEAFVLIAFCSVILLHVSSCDAKR